MIRVTQTEPEDVMGGRRQTPERLIRPESTSKRSLSWSSPGMGPRGDWERGVPG